MAPENLDEFGRLHFTIRLNGIRLIYEAREPHDSEIYLNPPAFPLSELNYRYWPNFSCKNEEFYFQPLNDIKEFILFNKSSSYPNTTSR